MPGRNRPPPLEKTSDNDPDQPDFAQASEQLAKLDPKPEETEREKGFDVVCNGAKWGLLAGFALAQIIISGNSPLGFYLGDLGLLFLETMGPGAAIGALFGWASLHMRNDETN